MTDRNILLFGNKEPQPEAVALTAGPLTLTYGSGCIRKISLATKEVINQIYFSFRDRNWVDIPSVIFEQKISVKKDSFQISFVARNQRDEISFDWQALITGDPSGEIRYEMKGVAQSAFWRNRLGLCVLHPARSCSGAACRVEHVDGNVRMATFPVTISPYQPFKEFRAVAHEVMPDLWAQVRFERGTFEMEDQRNWADDSFKSYSPPLSETYPVEVKAGSLVSQSVSLSLAGKILIPQKQIRSKKENLILSVHPETGSPVPQIGLGIASHGKALQEIELERLRQLKLHHLRVDLHLYEPDFAMVLHQAWEEARALGAVLEIALVFSEKISAELASLTRALAEIKPRISSWLIFQRNGRITPTSLVEIVKPQLNSLSPAVAVGGGAKTYFAELNRNPAIQAALDVVAYSLNPQVHVSDNHSLMESLPSQVEMVRCARQIIGKKPLLVTPVTLKPRFNPTTGEPSPSKPGELPSMVDPRQSSLFGASWTLGSLKYLCESGVDSITYYETTGWRGVMEISSGSPLPKKFTSFPGCVFPLYHVLADLGEFSNGQWVEIASSHPQWVAGLALKKDHYLRVILANLTETTSKIKLTGLGRPSSIRFLDETNAERAMKFPEEWRKHSASELVVKNLSDLELLPYAIATIDCHLTKYQA